MANCHAERMRMAERIAERKIKERLSYIPNGKIIKTDISCPKCKIELKGIFIFKSGKKTDNIGLQNCDCDLNVKGLSWHRRIENKDLYLILKKQHFRRAKA